VYYFGIVLLVISMPLSVFGMSLSQFILAGNWILQGQFRTKWEILKQRKSIIVVLALYALHLIWLFNTSDFDYAFKDLRIKLPLLILPLIIGTSPWLGVKRMIGVIYFLAAALVVSSGISIAVFLGITGKEITDYREMSIFISHIRFSLIINVAVFFLFYLWLKKTVIKYSWERIAILMTALWLAVFLFILRSQTGLVIFGLINLFFALKFLIRRKGVIRWSVLVGLIIIAVVFGFNFNKAMKGYFHREPTGILDSFTVNGKPYKHNTSEMRYENGFAVWNYYCLEEVKKEWEKRSKIDYLGKDERGNTLYQTLVRYMASKGLRKDSLGMTQMSDEDIRSVEKGIPNYIYNSRFSLYAFLYKQFWIIDSYIQGDNPSGHSLTQRAEYLKAATAIIADNYWLGTGTGDVQKAFDQYYATHITPLEKQWQLRAHNQFVTFFLSFGFIGFILVLFILVYPVLYEKRILDFWFMLPFIVALVSFLNEDTLETQAGITFFTFFYAFFLFREKENPELKKNGVLK
jgi:hypothetical protein